jgi:ACR3 family arsenite transporter
MSTEPAASTDIDLEEVDVLHRLSTLDRFLPVWILLAMAAGLLLGWALPGIQDVLDAVKIGETSLPIAIGLLLMMYPVLAKVHYEDMSRVTGDKPMLWSSLLLNWVIGPALMFTLAWVFLYDYPEFRTGLIVIGLARCIAMVLIWNDLACGDREAAALLVAINSVFQVLGYALLGTFYLEILPDWLGLPTEDVTFSTADITKSVLIFLGIPLAAGYLTRRILRPRKGADWYDNRFLPRIGPWALYGLLFTIVVMFALQGEAILNDPWSVLLIAVPLLAYFAIMWSVSFVVGRRARLGYPKTATLAFTAAGNNFELAIAVSIGVWGVTSGQALAGVIGPLIEVPALVGLVYVSLWLRRRLAWRRTAGQAPAGQPS